MAFMLTTACSGVISACCSYRRSACVRVQSRVGRVGFFFPLYLTSAPRSSSDKSGTPRNRCCSYAIRQCSSAKRNRSARYRPMAVLTGPSLAAMLLLLLPHLLPPPRLLLHPPSVAFAAVEAEQEPARRVAQKLSRTRSCPDLSAKSATQKTAVFPNSEYYNLRANTRTRPPPGRNLTVRLSGGNRFQRKPSLL